MRNRAAERHTAIVVVPDELRQALLSCVHPGNATIVPTTADCIIMWGLEPTDGHLGFVGGTYYVTSVLITYI